MPAGERVRLDLDTVTLQWLPPRWRWPLFVLGGVALGLGLALLRVSNATSYLSDDAGACLNCHVMNSAYATWQRGSHGRATVCNDCHVPHHNPIATLAFKGLDGLRHSWVFTRRAEPQVLTPNPAAIPVIQQNCLRCHAGHFTGVRLAGSSERPCWTCHDGVHGHVQSLSASPHARRPPLPPAGLLAAPGQAR